MSRYRPAYPPEFRRQMVDLVRSGRTPEDLASEFEPSAASIAGWVRRADGRARRARAFAPREPAAPAGTGHLSKGYGLVRSEGRPERAYELMRANQALHPVRIMARALGVSASGFYDWRDRAPSKRCREDEHLLRRIRTIHAVSQGTYGSPRVHAELRAEGIHVGRKRVARLLREAGIAGVSRRRRPFAKTTIRAPKQPSPSDLVRRDFSADGPDQLWVADITFVPTAAGFLFLAVVLDAWSRRIVGWAFSQDLRTRIVLDALDMALAARKPQGVIHHSDKGGQYTSLAFGARCRQAGVRPSTGSAGDAFDNAMCESFFATLEYELINRHRFASRAAAQIAVFRFVEGFYNPSRRHSSIGYMSPAEFEAAHQPDRAQIGTNQPETCP